MDVEAARSEKKMPVTFYVVPEGESLLSYCTASSLELVQILNSVSKSFQSDWKSEFQSVFHEVGLMKDKEVRLLINPDVHPLAQRYLRIPFQLRKAVDKELDRWLQLDITEEIKRPIPRVSPIVVV